MQQASRTAEDMGFEISCEVDVGRLLQVLAGSVRSGIAGEIGTGCGVGAAWLVTGLPSDVQLVTVELDQQRAEAAKRLLKEYPNADVVQGDWRQILEHGPFSLLFVDAKPSKQDQPELVVQSLTAGGIVVLDDLTPLALWPEEWQGRPDPVRAYWLNEPRLMATEVTVSNNMSAILATRR